MQISWHGEVSGWIRAGFVGQSHAAKREPTIKLKLSLSPRSKRRSRRNGRCYRTNRRATALGNKTQEPQTDWFIVAFKSRISDFFFSSILIFFSSYFFLYSYYILGPLSSDPFLCPPLCSSESWTWWPFNFWSGPATPDRAFTSTSTNNV